MFAFVFKDDIYCAVKSRWTKTRLMIFFPIQFGQPGGDIVANFHKTRGFLNYLANFPKCVTHTQWCRVNPRHEFLLSLHQDRTTGGPVMSKQNIVGGGGGGGVWFEAVLPSPRHNILKTFFFLILLATILQLINWLCQIDHHHHPGGTWSTQWILISGFVRSPLISKIKQGYDCILGGGVIPTLPHTGFKCKDIQIQ